MEKTKIFIASSITEYEYQRVLIGDFIRQLNNMLVENEQFVIGYFCEEMDHTVSLEGSQAVIDKRITESDFVIVLFGRSFGEYTVGELELACNEDLDVCLFYEEYDEAEMNEKSIYWKEKAMEIVEDNDVPLISFTKDNVLPIYSKIIEYLEHERDYDINGYDNLKNER